MNVPHAFLTGSLLDAQGGLSARLLPNGSPATGLLNLAPISTTSNNTSLCSLLSSNNSSGNVSMAQHCGGSGATAADLPPPPPTPLLLDDIEPQPRDRCNTWPLQKPTVDYQQHGHRSPLITPGTIPEEEDDDLEVDDDDGGLGAELDDATSTVSSSNEEMGGGLPASYCYGARARGSINATADYYAMGSGSNIDALTDANTLQQQISPSSGGQCSSSTCAPTTSSSSAASSSAAAAAAAKKNASRRSNAWGNNSYADLITQAISLSPEGRLTLNQIYEWFSNNIPFFKDKADSNSSAGWKNSIRHNLSLHSKFIRLQNEGAGKSSWWIINPDAPKSGKATRRRAGSMETGTLTMKYKQRGRNKKKSASTRNSTTNLASCPLESGVIGPEGSPSMLDGSNTIDLYDSTHNLNFDQCQNMINQSRYAISDPLQFRSRANSNLSEYGSMFTSSRNGSAPSNHAHLSPRLEENDPYSSSWDLQDPLPQQATASNELADKLSSALGSGIRGSNNRSPNQPVMTNNCNYVQMSSLEMLPPPPYRQPNVGFSAMGLQHDQSGHLMNGERLSPDNDNCGQSLLARISPGQSQILNAKSHQNLMTNGHLTSPTVGGSLSVMNPAASAKSSQSPSCPSSSTGAGQCPPNHPSVVVKTESPLTYTILQSPSTSGVNPCCSGPRGGAGVSSLPMQRFSSSKDALQQKIKQKVNPPSGMRDITYNAHTEAICNYLSNDSDSSPPPPAPNRQAWNCAVDDYRFHGGGCGINAAAFMMNQFASIPPAVTAISGAGVIRGAAQQRFSFQNSVGLNQNQPIHFFNGNMAAANYNFSSFNDQSAASAGAALPEDLTDLNFDTGSSRIINDAFVQYVKDDKGEDLTMDDINGFKMSFLMRN